MPLSQELLAEYRGPSASVPDVPPDHALLRRVVILEAFRTTMLKGITNITATLSERITDLEASEESLLKRIEVLEDEQRRQINDPGCTSVGECSNTD